MSAKILIIRLMTNTFLAKEHKSSNTVLVKRLLCENRLEFLFDPQVYLGGRWRHSLRGFSL